MENAAKLHKQLFEDVPAADLDDVGKEPIAVEDEPHHRVDPIARIEALVEEISNLQTKLAKTPGDGELKLELAAAQADLAKQEALRARESARFKEGKLTKDERRRSGPLHHPIDRSDLDEAVQL